MGKQDHMQEKLTPLAPVQIQGDTIGFDFSVENTWTADQLFDGTTQLQFFASGNKIAGGLTSLDLTGDALINIRIGVNSQVKFTDGTVEPITTNDIDIGTSSKEFKDAYFTGDILCSTLESDVATGTAPFIVASTTVVAKLNVDQVDGLDATDLVLVDGTQALTADWDVGAFDVRAANLAVDTAATSNGAGTITFGSGQSSGQSGTETAPRIAGLKESGPSSGHYGWIIIHQGTTQVYVPTYT